MKNIRFGIDLDGVLGDFTSEVVAVANSLWPGKMPPGYKPDNWDYQGVLTKEEWNQVWGVLIDTENLWLKEEELSGARELQQFLKEYPFSEVYFVTARAETKGMSVLMQSTRWLEERGLWPRWDRSFVIPVKHANEKIKILNDLMIPFFLDDHAPTIQALQALPNMRGAYLLDELHNRYASLPRVTSVTEYLDIVKEQSQ